VQTLFADTFKKLLYTATYRRCVRKQNASLKKTMVNIKNYIILIVIILLTSCAYNSSEYYNAVISNVLSSTISGEMSPEGRKELVFNELSRLTHKNALKALEEIEMLNPVILKSIKRDIRLMLDKKYKESLSKN
jgi:hypothetical protein